MMHETAKRLDALETLIDDEFGQDEDEDQEGIFCVACNKSFKSRKQYAPIAVVCFLLPCLTFYISFMRDFAQPLLTV